MKNLAIAESSKFRRTGAFLSLNGASERDWIRSRCCWAWLPPDGVAAVLVALVAPSLCLGQGTRCECDWSFLASCEDVYM